MKKRSTAIALVVSTIMTISAFSMVYAGGSFHSSETNALTTGVSSSPMLKSNNSTIQHYHVSTRKVESSNVASQITLNKRSSDANVKYFKQQFSSFTVDKKLYPIYFNQTGLPLGEPWNITINQNATQTFNISYVTYLPDGTYNYSISNSGNFYPAAGEGTFTINSSGVEIQVYFQSSLAIDSTLAMDNNSLFSGIHFSNELNYEPYGAVYYPINGFYYVSDLAKGVVSVLNGTTGSIYKNVIVGSLPLSMAYNPHNGDVYVANSGGSTVTVIDSNLSVQGNLTIMHSPHEVLYDPVSGDLFVSNSSEVVGVLSPNGTVKYTHFNSNVSQLVLDSNNGDVFVKTSLISIYSGTIKANSSQIYYIDSTGRIIDGFNTSSNNIPNFIAFDPVENSLYSVFYINSTRNMVETNSSGHVLETWNLPYSPKGIFYNSFSGNIFILGYSHENTTIFTYSGGMNFIGSMHVEGEIHEITFSSKGQIFPDSAEDDVYYASPVTHTRGVSITEKGLSHGTLWGFRYAGHEFITHSRIINFTALSSNISIQFLNETGYIVTNNLTIPSGTGSLTYSIQYHRMYPIAIFEKGLPTGTQWNVSIESVSYTSTSGIITLNLTNGTYSLLLGRSGIYYPDPSNTTLSVNGSGLNLTVVFGVSKYTVQFHEYGLPSGSVWYLNLSNGYHFVSQNSTISILLPNDTYYYTISSKTKIYSPISSSGSFTVNGESYILTVNFTVVTYSVNINETGLPAGITWYLDINGSTINLQTSKLSLNYDNGTYTYSVQSSDSSYYPSESTGTFTVHGSNVDLNIVFKELTFKILFSESGLPPGASWFVNLTNGKTLKTENESVSLMLPNGTYHYTLSVTDKTFEPSFMESTFVVNGSSVSMNIPFKMVVYNVTLSLSTVPVKTYWSLYINGKNTSTFSVPDVHINLPNGSFSYTVNVWNHIYRSTSGNFTVKGQNLAVGVHVTMMRYMVNVKETGLPLSSLWYFNLSNGEKLYSSSNIVSVELTNGTYDYVLGSSNSSFHPLFSTGMIRVSGSNVTVTVVFNPTLYKVTFSGRGNLEGYWYANLSSGNNSGPISAGSSYAFELSNGTYSFTITVSNSSYGPSYTTGSFRVDGSNFSIPISFSEVNYTVTFNYNLHKVPWRVIIGNESEFSPFGEPIVFNLPNGSYTFSALIGNHGKEKHYVTYTNGTFTVKGKNVDIVLNFKKLHRVLISVVTPQENIDWFLSIDGTYYASKSNSMVIKLPSGNYSASFDVNFTLSGPDPGSHRQQGKEGIDYFNITVPFLMNVSGPTLVFIVISPSPVELNIIIISGTDLPHTPPSGIFPPTSPFHSQFPALPPPFANNPPGLFSDFRGAGLLIKEDDLPSIVNM